MADAEWPDGDARYEFAGGRAGAGTRWQDGIDAGLRSGALELSPAGGDTYTLVGRCPRCGHDMDQVLEFRVIQRGGADIGLGSADRFSVRTRPVETARFDIVCSCAEKHAGRQETQKGCGWGRGLPVTVSRTR